MERPKIGELLVAAGVIDPPTLEIALEKQRAEGGRLGKILLGMGALDEEMLVRSVARQLDMPVAWLRGKQVRADVLLMLPRHVALKHRCLPVMLDRKGTETLLVAMEDPSDTAALDEVAVAAGRPVRVVLSAPSELDEALARHYPESQEEDGEDEEPELLLTETLGEARAGEPELRRLAQEEAFASPPAEDPLDLRGGYDPGAHAAADPVDFGAGGDDLGLGVEPSEPEPEPRAPRPGDSLDDAIDLVRGAEPPVAEGGGDAVHDSGDEESESLFGDDPLEVTLPPAPRRSLPAELLPRDPELRAIAVLLIERGLLRSEDLSERLLALRRDGDDSGS